MYLPKFCQIKLFFFSFIQVSLLKGDCDSEFRKVCLAVTPKLFGGFQTACLSVVLTAPRAAVSVGGVINKAEHSDCRCAAFTSAVLYAASATEVE